MDVLPVKFNNRDGLALFGILHLPDRSVRRSTVVLLLSPGVKMRVAPHRLYLKLAERFVALGFPVFRFDYHGLGDSEGELAESVLLQVYRSVQSGRYAADTVDAMNWLEDSHGFSRFIAGGLCGGAISGLLAGQHDRRIEALWALGIPASLEGLPESGNSHLTRGQLGVLGQGYIRKLVQPKAWLRFLTFQSSYDVILRSIRERMRGAQPAAAPDSGRPDAAAMGNSNPKFGPAFFSMVESSRPMLLIFGGADRWRWEFEEKFEEPNAARLAPYRDLFEKHTIPDANHILSSDEWLETAISLTERWLQRTQGS